MNRSLAVLFLAILALRPAHSEVTLSLPSWLENYPGATAEIHSSESLIESRYSAADSADKIVEHYRKLFEAAGVAFQPNFDGMGTSIRAAVPECNLLIQIRSRDEGSAVTVNCAANTTSAAVAGSPNGVKVTTSR